MKLFEPMHNLMIVRIIPQSKKTAGGIILAEGAKSLSPLNKAEVLAVGPGYIQPDGSYIPMKIKEGDIVTNCNGNVALRHIPTNTLFGGYDFK